LKQIFKKVSIDHLVNNATVWKIKQAAYNYINNKYDKMFKDNINYLITAFFYPSSFNEVYVNMQVQQNLFNNKEIWT